MSKLPPSWGCHWMESHYRCPMTLTQQSCETFMSWPQLCRGNLVSGFFPTRGEQLANYYYLEWAGCLCHRSVALWCKFFIFTLCQTGLQLNCTSCLLTKEMEFFTSLTRLGRCYGILGLNTSRCEIIKILPDIPWCFFSRNKSNLLATRF